MIVVYMCTSTNCPVSGSNKTGFCPFETCKEFKTGNCGHCKYYARHEAVCCNYKSKYYGIEMGSDNGCEDWVLNKKEDHNDY